MSGPVTLQRETFELSREMEFFTERELTAQIGHNRYYWPVALLKELLDNALDACESADIAPVITADLQEDALIVTDNGPGLPLATLEGSLNYAVRVSDKTGYVSPSRGQQGNALKTLWAAPFVVTGEGRITVETADYRREVRVTLDRIAQKPRLECVDTDPPDVKSGTRITLHWKNIWLPAVRRPAQFLQHGLRSDRLQPALPSEGDQRRERPDLASDRARLATLATRPPDRPALVHGGTIPRSGNTPVGQGARRREGAQRQRVHPGISRIERNRQGQSDCSRRGLNRRHAPRPCRRR